MQPQKTRWSKVYESSEEELLEFLKARNIAARRHTLVEFEPLEAQRTDSSCALWCAEGSMTVRLEGPKLSLQPGDTLRLPSGTAFDLVAGISGCVYYTSV